MIVLVTNYVIFLLVSFGFIRVKNKSLSLRILLILILLVSLLCGSLMAVPILLTVTFILKIRKLNNNLIPKILAWCIVFCALIVDELVFNFSYLLFLIPVIPFGRFAKATALTIFICSFVNFAQIEIVAYILPAEITLLAMITMDLVEFYIHDTRRLNYVIGIAGDSGSGKTTLARFFKSHLDTDRSVYIEADGLHKWERGDSNWNLYTHLNPKANELHKQLDMVEKLKMHQVAFGRDYEHSNGTFSKEYVIRPKEYIVLIGLHPWYLPKMREVIDLKIFLATDEILRRHWKILRDVIERGHSKEKVVEQIERRVEDAGLFVNPQRDTSDIVLTIKTKKIDLIPGELHEQIELFTLFAVSASFDLSEELNRFTGEDNWSYSKDSRFIEFELDGTVGELHSDSNKFFTILIDKLISYKDAVNNRFR